MKWTKVRPVSAGYYWVLFEYEDLHQQGPIVFEIEFDEGEMIMTDSGKDYMRVLAKVEEEYGPVKLWSDRPISLPEGGEK